VLLGGVLMHKKEDIGSSETHGASTGASLDTCALRSARYWLKMRALGQP